ncbi:DEKNAAC104171 [Brettanomyces naardenensis]|uniref:DEKNAAC104171 n=1 Tax=Brettanomyces naardenensis TaxID=13370 RepID=A0A448YQ59_BRENA|nr:DEKNAAC104171 [Brettanomyces naardenensis]
MAKRRVLGAQHEGASGRPEKPEGSGTNLVPNGSGTVIPEVAVYPPSSIVTSASPMTLSCPICSEKMVTLAQLNQHLDDEHTTVDNGTGDRRGSSIGIEKDFKNWFKERVIDNFIGPQQQREQKKLKQLDVFESNFTFSDDGGDTPKRSDNDEGIHNGSPRRRHKKKVMSVPRSHWQKPSGNDFCHTEGCNKSLGLKNGLINCRKCGKLFCDYHTMYRMKLNEKLENDTVHGIWCRVCASCFVGRDCWNGVNEGFHNDLSYDFHRLRDKKVVPINLDRLALQKRLFRLLGFLELVDSGKQSLASYRRFERDLVPWEDDKERHDCKICHWKFSLFVRRHHCRVCGLSVCGDPERGCSMPVPLDLVTKILNIRLPEEEDRDKFGPFSERIGKIVSIRLCLDCKRMLFVRRFNYRDCKKLEDGDLMKEFDRFSELRSRIEKVNDVTDELRLIDYFSKIEQMAMALSGKVKGMEKAREEAGDFNVQEYRLYRSFQQRIVGYLQENLPKLRRIQKRKIAEEKRLMEGKPKKKLLKRDIRIKREKLMVLTEQKFMIENLHEEYKKQRKFDDLQALDDNMADLEKEIGELKLELGEDAF